MLTEKQNFIEETSENISLFSFAFCGTNKDFVEFSLTNLAKLAEPENWHNEDNDFGILNYYIRNTFKRCHEKELIVYNQSEDSCIFNTGLLTSNGNEIVGLFEKNDRANAQQWRIKGFFGFDERIISHKFTKVPELATYTDDPAAYYFNIKDDIILSTDHVIDDNWDRYDQRLQSFGKSVIKTLLPGAFEVAKKKVRRNAQLAVPQFYNGELMFLLPISFPLNDTDQVIMALAIEKLENGKYRANTIFTTKMAYQKARLLSKPDSNWLLTN